MVGFAGRWTKAYVAVGTAAETTLADVLDGWRLMAGDPMEGGVGTGGLLECDQPTLNYLVDSFDNDGLVHVVQSAVCDCPNFLMIPRF